MSAAKAHPQRDLRRALCAAYPEAVVGIVMSPLKGHYRVALVWDGFAGWGRTQNDRLVRYTLENRIPPEMDETITKIRFLTDTEFDTQLFDPIMRETARDLAQFARMIGRERAKRRRQGATA